MKAVALVAPLALSAVLLSGCGGSGATSVPPSSTAALALSANTTTAAPANHTTMVPASTTVAPAPAPAPLTGIVFNYTFGAN